MSTNPKATPPVLTPLTLRELGEVLVRHYKIKEGHYDVLIQYQFGAGAFGPTPEQTVPGFAIGVQAVGLAPAATIGALTIDAASVSKSSK